MREMVSSSRIEYINSLFGREDQILKKIVKQLNDDKKFGINVSAYEGGLLAFLITITKPKVLVEFGTLYGYSTLWMARALQNDSIIYTLEKNEENAKVAQKYFEQSSYREQINLVVGDAKDGMKKLPDKVDLVFIDANKSSYMDYLKWALNTVQPGGLIIGDNTFLFGSVCGEDSEIKVSAKQIEVMKEFNRTLAEAPNFCSTMLPTPEGMTIAYRV